MAGTNTEKPTGKAEAKKNVVAPKINHPEVSKAPVETHKQDSKINEENKTEEKSAGKKADKKIIKKIQKDEVVVNARSVAVSTKYAMAICKFIKYKKIDKAIEDLEQVTVLRKAVSMKGEIPHRKGKGMMSGRFPVNASKEFIILLKSLKGNANNHEVDDAVITEAIANFAHRPFGRDGKLKKRTHITLKARSKNNLKKLNSKNKIKK